MNFEIKESKSLLKEGEYVAKFSGYSDAPPKQGYREGIRWEFEIVKGACAGRKPTRITPMPATPSNAAGVFIQHLTGCELKAGVLPDVDGCIGKLYQITVNMSKGGYPIVDKCERL